MIIYAATLLCVIGLSIGQVLFKMSATALTETGSFFSIKTLATLFPALCLYGLTTLLWVWVLQKIELGKVYPFMALAFVLVPFASHFIFGERFETPYFLGVVLIMAGIIIIARST
ncbi:MAG: EamA family transporter [Gammaproteobacteria bacterium]